MPVGYGYISFEAGCEVTCEDTKIVFYSGMTNNRLFEWFNFQVTIEFGFRDIKQ